MGRFLIETIVDPDLDPFSNNSSSYRFDIYSEPVLFVLDLVQIRKPKSDFGIGST